WVGGLMMAGFVIHTAYLLTRINWRTPLLSIFGPDSLVPNLTDLKDTGKRIRWFFGLGPPPRFDRWAYWENFDYWAVYWGLPLLAVTGLMLIYPIPICRFLPGWSLNIAIILHRAEAVLAVSYIFIVHFFIGHIRPASFPMNEAMFSGNVPLADIHMDSICRHPDLAISENQSRNRLPDFPCLPPGRKPGVDGIESPDYDQSHLMSSLTFTMGAVAGDAGE
ncbi:MAG: hypothetical protein AB7S77_14385, partial [Desulfatirhabdiaceae bacterium]